MVAGILLAAGESTRMGRNKLLLRLEGETLLRRAARRALSAGLDPVIAVLGREVEAGREALAGLACRIARNPEPGAGMGRSIAAGLAALPEASRAAVVLLADMPLVEASMIAALVERFLAGGAPLVASRYGEVLAPPTLFARELFAELAGEAGEGRAGALRRRLGERAAVVDQPAGAVLDVDRDEDLELARSGAGR